MLVLIETALFKSGFHLKLVDQFKCMLLVGLVYLILCLATTFSCITIYTSIENYFDANGNGITIARRQSWRWERNGFPRLFAAQKIFMVLNFYFVKTGLGAGLRNPNLYII